MSNAVRKFINRAPRYVLRPQDDQMLRFSFDDENTSPIATEFVNLSTTGLAFVVDHQHMPLVGEELKIEFPVPGDKRIAWLARVVRIEEYRKPSWRVGPDRIESPKVMVGVRFLDLPAGHQDTIARGLDKKFVELVREQRLEYGVGLLKFASENLVKACIYIVLTVLVAWMLWALSRPSANYDKDRGAPWGDRF